ncbi:conserved hypothetical protein [Marinoscillum sp. 108]|nr:conserved hypothetical protein [Marinoscillum sp. 108]
MDFMDQDDLKLIGIIASIVIGLLGAGWFVNKNSNNKSNKSKQKNISINGNNNRIVGADDNSGK